MKPVRLKAQTEAALVVERSLDPNACVDLAAVNHWRDHAKSASAAPIEHVVRRISRPRYLIGGAFTSHQKQASVCLANSLACSHAAFVRIGSSFQH